NGLGIALLGLESEGLLADIVRAQRRLDLAEGFRDEVLQMPHLREGVVDEVFESFADGCHGRTGFRLEGLSPRVEFGPGNQIAYGAGETLLALPVVLGKIAQDALGGALLGSVALAGDVALGLEI